MMEPIEGTPLGIARKAIDTAEDEISEAWRAWMEHPTEAPWDYSEMSIEPDHESLGFALVLDFNDGPRQPADSIAARLGGMLARLGIGTVRCVGVEVDSADVPEVQA